MATATLNFRPTSVQPGNQPQAAATTLSPSPDLVSNFSVGSSSPKTGVNKSGFHDNSSAKLSFTSGSKNNHKILRKPTSLLSLKKKSSTQTIKPQPTPLPELPPLDVAQHYQDLTNLFEAPDSSASDSQQEATTRNSEKVNNNSTTMGGLGIDTSFGNRKSDLASGLNVYSSQQYAHPQSNYNDDSIRSVNNASDIDYEYYDYDADSIQASPVDIAPRQGLSTLDPSSRQTSGMTNTPTSSHTTYSAYDHPQGTTSPPASHQNSAFNHHSPPTFSMNNTNVSHSSSQNSKQQQAGFSAVSKVRNMFPGFGSYKSLNKVATGQETEPEQAVSSPYNFPNDSALSFVEGDATENALVANHSDSRLKSNANSTPPFGNRKPAPHFNEIESGSTYRAQVIPVKNDSAPTSANSSPYLRQSSSLNPEDEHENLLHSRNKSETLDFVPNLRPAIDNVGSRLRSAGVPSPATLMMTKIQYEKYLQSEKDGEKKTEEGAEEEDDDNEEDDESDDEHGNRSRRVLEDEEAKKSDFRMRMKQEAHLSVYRQKMTKLTGSQIGLPLNSSVPSSNGDASNSDYDSEEDYDDVPLGILKAHGFPTTGRLKTMKSQINMNDDSNLLQPPQLYGGQSRPSGDNMSLRSFQSNGPARPMTPAAPEEGYLAMRNMSTTNVPGFNASVPMNRGLVGEIAKEEQNKAKRKGLLNDMANQRTNTMAGSFLGPNDNASVINEQAAQQQPSEIQNQLQQMMQMQTQILQQMAASSAQSTPMTMMSSPGMMTPMSFGNGPMRKNWSSFDVMNSSQLMPSRGGAPSIRSVARSEHSIRSYAGPQTARYQPAHRHQNTVHSFDMAAMGHQSNNDFTFPPRQATPQQAPPQQNSVRLVDVDEDDDDEDDEAGWKEMEQRRQQLRQMWDTQPAVVL